MTARPCALAACLAFAAVAQARKPLYVPPGIQEQRLVHHVPPEYPKLARDARIQGPVRLAVLIAEDGTVERLRLISGHPFLVTAAMDAVKRWRYRPAWRGGVRVAVFSTVEVNFTLGRRGGAGARHVHRVKMRGDAAVLHPFSAA